MFNLKFFKLVFKLRADGEFKYNAYFIWRSISHEKTMRKNLKYHEIIFIN